MHPIKQQEIRGCNLQITYSAGIDPERDDYPIISTKAI
jgi:hypothetical protein